MIRVLIYRHVAEGMLESYLSVIRQARLQATRMGGYISGETLRDFSDPHHFIVISSWEARADWDRWKASEARHEAITRIAPMLDEPERIIVLESL